MKVEKAIAASGSHQAEGMSARGNLVVAMRRGDGMRIVKSYTDPTTVRPLSKHELRSEDWRPV